ncbi:hypothetical protein DL95DRAFT_398332 [Leptodontidium sp. 2 PMI_412]|nr:hypothetical protein DL95DRAFT_398332 [Leptodontidium sp. 2 PMI_412]
MLWWTMMMAILLHTSYSTENMQVVPNHHHLQPNAVVAGVSFRIDVTCSSITGCDPTLADSVFYPVCIDSRASIVIVKRR